MKYIHLSFKWVNREVNNGILKKKVNKYRTKLKKKKQFMLKKYILVHLMAYECIY